MVILCRLFHLQIIGLVDRARIAAPVKRGSDVDASSIFRPFFQTFQHTHSHGNCRRINTGPYSRLEVNSSALLAHKLATSKDTSFLSFFYPTFYNVGLYFLSFHSSFSPVKEGIYVRSTTSLRRFRSAASEPFSIKLTIAQSRPRREARYV